MQYFGESVSLLWNGGDPESGIADYEVAAMAYVGYSGGAIVDDDGALLLPESTHKQNWFKAVRVGAIDGAPRLFYRITAANKYVSI